MRIFRNSGIKSIVDCFNSAIKSYNMAPHGPRNYSAHEMFHGTPPEIFPFFKNLPKDANENLRRQQEIKQTMNEYNNKLMLNQARREERGHRNLIKKESLVLLHRPQTTRTKN